MDTKINDSQSVIHGPAASGAPKTLLEVQIFVPHPTCTESETLGVGPSNLF